jgi:hypothetical protein
MQRAVIVTGILASALALLASGCGGGDGSSNDVSEDEISAALRLTESGSALVYQFAPGKECQIGQILTTSDEIAQAEDYGDSVATNPDGTAGVSFAVSPVGGELDDCVGPAENDLASLSGG